MDIIQNFETLYCKCQIITTGKYDLKIKGTIEENVKDSTIYYMAAAPADHRATYTGSGLPFKDQIQAFDNTPNVGIVKLDMSNSFEINLMIPNSYMVGLGSVTVPPTLYIEYINGSGEKKLVSIKVSNGIPYRSLTYPVAPKARGSVSFYDSQFGLEVRGQEQILREAGYPKVNEMPANHFGTKPPL